MNSKQNCIVVLIEKFEVTFPQNLPYTISGELQSLIKELLVKNKHDRLGYCDQGGAQDVLDSLFFKQG